MDLRPGPDGTPGLVSDRGNSSRRANRAFSLPEVLIALLIFFMATIVLAGAYVNVLNSYQAANTANDNDADIAFARSQLLAQADLQTAETGASFDASDSRHVTWSATVDTTDTTDLFSVTFTCQIDDPTLPQPKKVVQTFMLLRPSWSDPATRTTQRQTAASRVAAVQGRPPPQ